MESLFEIEPTLSPKLAWIEKHNILTHEFDRAEPEQRWMAILPMPEDEGLDIVEAMARHCRIYDEGGRIGYGHNETEAIANLAVKCGLKLWNEEGV